MTTAPGKVRFFTCKIGYTGIGDQLSQLRTLYRIGRAFDLTYVHTPFGNLWCPGLDVNRFLGLDLGEERIEDFRGHRMLDVPYLALLDHLHRKQPLESMFSEQELRPPVLFRLCSAQEIYSTKPDVRAIPPGVRFDLSAKFSAAHKDATALNPFRTDKLKVAVHVRRGDCCWVEDNGVIVFPYRNKTVPLGASDVDLQRALPLSYYTAVLDDLFSVYSPDTCEIRIYSDGYGTRIWGPLRAKARLRLVLGLIAGYLGIPSAMTPRVSMFDLRVWPKLAELRREFDVFTKYGSSIEFRVGQSVALTKEVIGAFAFADVGIVARRGAFPDFALNLNPSQVVIHPGVDTTVALKELRVAGRNGRR